MKIPIVNRKDYTQYIEIYADCYWLHTDVYNWTASVRKKFIKDLDSMQQLINKPLYALVDNPKLGKFADIVGFKYGTDAKGQDGIDYKIYYRSVP